MYKVLTPFTLLSFIKYVNYYFDWYQRKWWCMCMNIIATIICVALVAMVSIGYDDVWLTLTGAIGKGWAGILCINLTPPHLGQFVQLLPSHISLFKNLRTVRLTFIFLSCINIKFSAVLKKTNYAVTYALFSVNTSPTCFIIVLRGQSTFLTDWGLFAPTHNVGTPSEVCILKY